MRIKKQEERWFEIPDDPDEGSILIKHLNPGEIADIMDKVFRQKVIYKSNGDQEPQPEFVQETDRRMDRELTLQAAIKDWKKFFDHNDRPLKCTPENIIRASREIEGFDAMVTRFRNILAADIQKEAVIEEEVLTANL